METRILEQFENAVIVVYEDKNKSIYFAIYDEDEDKEARDIERVKRVNNRVRMHAGLPPREEA